jgi:hypothetical protein
MGIVPFLFLATLAQASTVGTNAQDRVQAQVLLGEGATLYEHGDYLGALDRFNSAYAAYPSSKILFNIGQANQLLGRLLDAREAYQKFLDEAPYATREDRTDAQAWLGKLQKSLGQLTIISATAGADISLDGKAIGRSPLRGPVWAIPGRHQVTAIKSGDCPTLEYVEVASGSPTTVELRPLHSPLVAEAPVNLDNTPKPQTANGWWLGRKWTWVAAGSTVLLTGAATAVGLTVKTRFDDLKRFCGRGSPGQQGCSDSDIDSLHTRKMTANVLWGLAGAAAVSTGILFFIEGRPVAVAPMAGEATGMLARMEF